MIIRLFGYLALFTALTVTATLLPDPWGYLLLSTSAFILLAIQLIPTEATPRKNNHIKPEDFF